MQCSLNTDKEKEKSIEKAISDVILKFYVDNNIDFDIIIYEKPTNHINDVINEVTKELSHKTTVNIYTINRTLWDHQLNKSAVIFTESEKNFLHLNTKSMSIYHTEYKLFSRHFKQFKFLIYTEKVKSFYQLKDILFQFRNVKLLLPMDLRYFEFNIINTDAGIALFANVLYSEKKCGEFSLKFLNSFNKSSQKWIKELKNFEHFNDFHGCMLSFIIRPDYGPYFYVEDFNKYQKDTEGLTEEIIKGTQKFYGLTHEIIKSAAEKYNFTIHYTIYFTLRPNVKNPNYPVMIGTNNFNFSKNFFISMQVTMIRTNSKPFYSEPCGKMDFYYLITLNDFYTNYEKLLMPFDFTSWILLSLTMLITFFIIFGAHGCPQWIKVLIFGAGIKNPAFNTLGVMFGIAQIRLPRESRNRFALLLFIWFCLLFRTCYQSKLFEFMTSDMRKPLPASLEDLKNMNYTIIVSEISKDSIMEAVNGRESQFNDVIHHLIPSGITYHLVNHGIWLLQRPIHVEEQEKVRILSLADLEFGFVLWLASLSLPITCFLYEISIKYFHKMRKIIKQFVIERIIETILNSLMEKYYGRW